MENKKQEHSSDESRSTFRLGVFFIMLGLALFVATYDMLHLGGFMAYITWESVLVFLGVILIICRSYLAGYICLVGGGWFFMKDVFPFIPKIIKVVYWPGALVLLGIFLICTSFKKNK